MQSSPYKCLTTMCLYPVNEEREMRKLYPLLLQLAPFFIKCVLKFSVLEIISL